MIYVTQWQVLLNPYQAPEIATAKIHGWVGDRWVQTSRIEEVLGVRLVKTRSGSIYQLVGEQNSNAVFKVDESDPFEAVSRFLRIQNREKETRAS